MKASAIVPFFETLRDANPEPASELEYASVFELLAAVLLSAQATDKGVNKATRHLFAIAPTPQKMIALGLPAIEDAIKTIGLFRNKAKNLLATCRILVDEHGGQVPRTREALEALPGVGRKTANVVLNNAFGDPTLAVDTHVFRVSNRTGLAPGATCSMSSCACSSACPRLPRQRAPLADPARPLRLPGQATAVRGLRRRDLVRFGAEGVERPSRADRGLTRAADQRLRRLASSSAAHTASLPSTMRGPWRLMASPSSAYIVPWRTAARLPWRRQAANAGSSGARRHAETLPVSLAVSIACGSAATTASVEITGTSTARSENTLRPPQTRARRR